MQKNDPLNDLISKAKACYMSNAKWRKLFYASEQFNVVIGGVRWRLIKSDHTFENDLNVLSAVEGERFADCLPSPCLPLKYIDNIFIPAVYPNPKSDKKRHLPMLKNDLSCFKTHLNCYGKFPIFEHADGIEIRAYEW